MAKEDAEGGGLEAMFGGKSDEGSEGEDIARDILDAIKDDDAKALWLALQRAHEECSKEYGADEEEEANGG